MRKKSDDFHRLNNIRKDAERQAGLWTRDVQFCACVNGIYGPHQSMAWYNALMDEAASSACKLSPDHATVLRFWPRVLKDKHLHHSSDREATGKTGRAEFIKNIPHAFDGILTGQASAQEFFGFNRAHIKQDEIKNTKAIVLTNLVMNKGWCATVEDLEAPAQTAKVTDVNKGHVSIASASKSASETMASIQARCHNNLVAIASVSTCVDQQNDERLIALGERALFGFFNWLQRTLKGPESCVKYKISMARFEYLDMLKTSWLCLTDTVELERAGFTVNFSEEIASLPRAELEAMLKYETCQSKKLHRLVQRISSGIIGYFSEYSDNYPHKLALVNSDDDHCKYAMEEFAGDCKAFWKAKECDLINYAPPKVNQNNEPV